MPLASANLVVTNLMPTARLTGQERRAAIIDSAIQLFSEKGFRGVTTRELASAIGVSEPVLYQHFPSKRDLYNAIIESIAEQSAHPCGDGRLPNCGAGLDDREFLGGVADAIIRWHEDNPAFVRLFIFSALEGHELGDMARARLAKYREVTIGVQPPAVIQGGGSDREFMNFGLCLVLT